MPKYVNSVKDVLGDKIPVYVVIANWERCTPEGTYIEEMDSGHVFLDSGLARKDMRRLKKLVEAKNDTYPDSILRRYRARIMELELNTNLPLKKKQVAKNLRKNRLKRPIL